MIWLLLILLTPYPWRLLAWGLDAGRRSPKHVETWPEKRARLAHENQCEEVGAFYFQHYNKWERNNDDRL